jgi:hypothetical protein
VARCAVSPTFFLPSAVMMAKLIEVAASTWVRRKKTAEALDGTKMLNSYFSAPIVL